MLWRPAAMALTLAATACSSVQLVREPAQFIATAAPEVVYVTHRNRALIVIAHPRVSGDTVYGTWEGQARPVTVPLSQVQRVNARQRDGMRTAFLIGGLTVLAGAAVYTVVQTANGHHPDWYCDYTHAVAVCG